MGCNWRLVIGKHQSEGAAVIDSSLFRNQRDFQCERLSWAYRAIHVMTAVAVRAKFARGTNELAGIRDPVAREGGRKICAVIPDKLILLQACVAHMLSKVVKGSPEDKRRPVSDRAVALAVPGTSFAFRNALFVDIVVRRRRRVLPEIIRALVWIRQLTGLPGLNGQWYGLRFGTCSM